MAFFRIWHETFSIKDIIGTDVDQYGFQVVCNSNKIQNGERVGLVRHFDVGLAIVHTMISRRVENHCGTCFGYRSASPNVIEHVKIVARKRHNDMVAEDLLQVPTKLSIGSKQCDLHPARER